ncbi:MAG: hypothetical protein WA324_24420 [Bryobacteraceae bacterium]
MAFAERRSGSERFENVDVKVPASRQRRLIAGIILLLAVAGLAVRIFDFQRNFSLFTDECSICMNVLDRSIWGLTKTLEYDQAAPFGFLVLQKAVFGVFGVSDMITRIVPLAFALATVPLSILVAKRIFSSSASAVALVLSIALICLDRDLVYYASIAKQYTEECFVTLVLVYILARPLLETGEAVKTFRWPDWFLRNSRKTGTGSSVPPEELVGSPPVWWHAAVPFALVVFSPFLVWFSYGAVFILAGFGLALVGRAFVEKDRQRRLVTGCFCLCLLLNLVIFFALSARPAMANQWLANWWQAAYMPMWPPARTVRWLSATFLDLGQTVIHTHLSLLLPLGLVATSVYAIWRRSWIWLACLFSVLVCLAASALGKYPFGDRLVLFLLPIMALMLAKSVDLLSRKWRTASLVVAAIILAGTATRLVRGMTHRLPIDDVRKVHRRMVAEFAPGDDLWVAPISQPCFRYYARDYPLPPNVSVHFLRRTEAPATLPSGRHWLLVIRFAKAAPLGQKLLDDFSRLGQQKESFDADWTTARLIVVP